MLRALVAPEMPVSREPHLQGVKFIVAIIAFVQHAFPVNPN